MKKYDFEKMGGIWKDDARKITENGVFVAHSGNWDLWEYNGIIYSIPVSGTGAGASGPVRSRAARLRKCLYCLFTASRPSSGQ